MFGHAVEFKALQQATHLWVLHYDCQSIVSQIMWARVRDDLALYDKVCRDEFSAAKVPKGRSNHRLGRDQPAAQGGEWTLVFGATDSLSRDTDRGPNHHTVRGAVAENSAKVIAKIALRSASTNPTTPRSPRKAE